MNGSVVRHTHAACECSTIMENAHITFAIEYESEPDYKLNRWM